MKIGVVGNREGWEFEFVKNCLDNLGVNGEDTVITGGANGVDKFAEDYCKQKGISVKVFYPDKSKPSPDRYFERNKLIVQNSDFVVAFNKKGTRGGTLNTINQAKELGVRVIVIE
jgi:predicted Rossmann fold nucleotide-binding protein DprA/Smf involved in DNA uptake